MSDKVKLTAMNYDADRPAAKNPIKIMDLSLRDGHQSLFVPVCHPWANRGYDSCRGVDG